MLIEVNREHLQTRLRSLQPGNHSDRITITIAAAILNPSTLFHWYHLTVLTKLPVRLEFDVERLADYIKNTVQKEGAKTSKSNLDLPKYFKMPNLGEVVDPATVIDRHGRILLWYLPDIIIERLVIVMIDSVSMI